MQTTILLDHDLEGHATYLQAGLRETGWDRDVTVVFVRLRDLGLPDGSSDQDIWRFAQQHRLLLITSNRNQENETSLQATLERENTPEALPVLTLSQANRLLLSDYRQQAAHKLVEIIIYLENYLGVGRIYIS
jgi:Domain of unknown function (DUF5615)